MKGMTLIVKTVTRWVKVFIFLFGVYIVITGHLGPGGGFAGGLIIACSYILLTLAFFSAISTSPAGAFSLMRSKYSLPVFSSSVRVITSSLTTATTRSTRWSP